MAKKEYEKVINELLGTNIKFSKLKKDELVELSEALAKLVKEKDKQQGQGKLVDKVLEKWKFPVLQKLKEQLL